jgi:hypothetical protein
MMNKIILLISILFLSITNTVSSQTNEVQAKGEYANIDTQEEIMRLLKSEDQKTVKKAEDSIIAKPNNYNPMVLYVLSSTLFEQKKKDEAMYWYYVAQLRARYDANLCLDVSAKQTASYLGSMFGAEINPYAFKNVKKLEATVDKVVAFVKNNEEEYDHRWINLSGMDAMIESLDEKTENKEMSKPKAEWAAIKKETINSYADGFKEALMELRKRK